MSDAPPAPRRGLALACIVLANVIGGVSYPVQKMALPGLPPATVTLLRNLVALIALFVCVRLRGKRGPAWSGSDWRRVLALGSVAFALPMWLGILGVERVGASGASNASILILLEPITIVGIACLVQGEHVGAFKLTSLALGLAGALAIVLEGASLGELAAGEHFAGNALLALHGILWGCYTPIAKPLSERHDPFELCLRATLVGVLALVPAALSESARWSAAPELAPALGWTVALGLGVSFGGTVLWLIALRHIPSTNVAGFVFLQPLSGVLAGVGLLGEQLSSSVLLGGALIVLGVGVDALLTAKRAPEGDA